MMAPESMGEHVCAQGKFAKRALQTSSPSSRQNHCLRPIARPELSAKDRLDPACLACAAWRQIPLCGIFPFPPLEQKRGGLAEREGTADGTGELPTAHRAHRKLGAARAVCLWPERRDYELIRPPLLSGMSVAERSRQIEASESRLRCGITGFKNYGMSSLLEPDEVERHPHFPLRAFQGRGESMRRTEACGCGSRQHSRSI